MTPFETIKYRDHTIELHVDENPINPREDPDSSLGLMACYHGRYSLGDKKEFEDHRDLDKYLEAPGVLSLPIYMMDHGGISLRTDSSTFRACDSVGWDWGKLGYIYTNPERMRIFYGVKRITKAVKEKVLKQLQAEVDVYNSYVSGDCFVFIIKGPGGEEIEDGSLWGFMSDDKEYALDEARGVIDHVLENLKNHTEKNNEPMPVLS